VLDRQTTPTGGHAAGTVSTAAVYHVLNVAQVFQPIFLHYMKRHFNYQIVRAFFSTSRPQRRILYFPLPQGLLQGLPQGLPQRSMKHHESPRKKVTRNRNLDGRRTHARHG
jgi:hypothetical protein